MESSSKHVACLLKIESPTKGWHKSLEKLFNTINDAKFTIDKRSKTIYVYGKIDPQEILEKVIKSGQEAKILWSENGCKKEVENPKDNFMSSCGYVNGHNGLWNYNQQQCYNNPQPYWMNQLQQPYAHQPQSLPPPYVQQFHPQPPPPPPYEYHQNGPAAKTFPPTPAPPKNFTMGDLQLGLCNIM